MIFYHLYTHPNYFDEYVLRPFVDHYNKDQFWFSQKQMLHFQSCSSCKFLNDIIKTPFSCNWSIVTIHLEGESLGVILSQPVLLLVIFDLWYDETHTQVEGYDMWPPSDIFLPIVMEISCWLHPYILLQHAAPYVHAWIGLIGASLLVLTRPHIFVSKS